MSITENGNELIMPVAPMYSGGGNNNNGGLNGDWGWIVLLLLLAGNGGWGFGGFGGMGGMMGLGMMDGFGLYPWMNQAEVTTNGFQNLSTQNQITAVQSDLGDIQTQLCNGFAGVNATINSTASNAETAANARAMANMQQLFGLSQQFSDCCCENRLANCQTQNVIQREAAETRSANASNTQTILDKLCQLELDGKQDRINDLERQLTMANLSASQIAQTAQIRAGQLDTMNNLVNELRSCPIPSQPVYGSQPIFTCNGNNGCGCGGNNF